MNVHTQGLLEAITATSQRLCESAIAVLLANLGAQRDRASFRHKSSSRFKP
jgi:hypothetical protein